MLKRKERLLKEKYNNKCYNKSKLQKEKKRPSLKQESRASEVYPDLFLIRGLFLM